MSLLDNISDVSYTSTASVDKIVGVWEGTFNGTSDTTTRTNGFLATLNIYSIPHGFTRPLFLSLLWSPDGTTWQDGGNLSLAFSDSTNIYIVAGTTGTNYYKVIGYWIDSYDGTDPDVPAFTTGQDKPVFDSRVNFQKIATEGESTYSPGTFGSQTTVTITHDLGYIPNAKAFFEPIDGEVWPLNAGGTSNQFLYDFNQDEAWLEIYSNRIDIVVNRFSNDTRKVWYKVYYDA